MCAFNFSNQIMGHTKLWLWFKGKERVHFRLLLSLLACMEIRHSLMIWRNQVF